MSAEKTKYGKLAYDRAVPVARRDHGLGQDCGNYTVADMNLSHRNPLALVKVFPVAPLRPSVQWLYWKSHWQYNWPGVKFTVEIDFPIQDLAWLIGHYGSEVQAVLGSRSLEVGKG